MTEGLLQRYHDAAVRHGEGMDTGDYKKTNKAYDELNQLLKQISDAGMDEKLFELYESENFHVQLWAATHTLEINEKKSISKLRLIELLDNGTMAGFCVHETIAEWKKGVLKFRG